MANLKTVEDCRQAALMLGVDFIKDCTQLFLLALLRVKLWDIAQTAQPRFPQAFQEESTEDFPNGCYHIDVGPFQGGQFMVSFLLLLGKSRSPW